METVTVHVPATSANLGPGFDCLGLALDLWNLVTFTHTGERIKVKIHGLGSRSLPKDGRNLIARSALRLYAILGAAAPEGLLIECHNDIPLDSGLGSSAAACLSGLMGANGLLGYPVSREDILRIATEMEGHPDNVAAAQLGGLVLVSEVDGKPLARRLDLVPLEVAVAIPELRLSTHTARSALPREIPLKDAVFNVGRAIFVVEALRSGDLTLLGQVMDDRIHQPYRFKLIPGAVEAVVAALKAGAYATALSGAGPSMIAFNDPKSEPETTCIAEAMVQAFAGLGIQAEGLALKVTQQGAWTE